MSDLRTRDFEFENAIKGLTEEERRKLLISALYHRANPDVSIEECVAYAERVIAAPDEQGDCK